MKRAWQPGSAFQKLVVQCAAQTRGRGHGQLQCRMKGVTMEVLNPGRLHGRRQLIQHRGKASQGRLLQAGERGLTLGRWPEILLEEKEGEGQCEQGQCPAQKDRINSVSYGWSTGHREHNLRDRPSWMTWVCVPHLSLMELGDRSQVWTMQRCVSWCLRGPPGQDSGTVGWEQLGARWPRTAAPRSWVMRNS